MTGSFRLFAIISTISAFVFHADIVRAETITVFAAASLKETLEATGKLFHEKTGTEIRFSFASSSVLAKQIEAGAPADLFASADLKWMDYLDAKHLIQHETRTNLLGNELVVVAPIASALNEITFTHEAFDPVLGRSRLATGDVTSVPVGVYAKSAFESLGLWSSVEPRLAQTENVRAALAFVSRGEVELGVVYKTDTAVEPSVKMIATFPAASHEPIVYPFALTASSQSPQARDFLVFLASLEARAIFENAGFQFLNCDAKRKCPGG